MPTISFPDNETRIKGIGAMMKSRYGFSGLGNNRFGVSEDVIKYLTDNKIEFTIE